MLQSVVRRPATAGEVSADVVRLIGVLSLVATAVWFSSVDVALLLLVLLGLLILRALRLPPAADAATGLILLAAAWSSVADVYAAVPWWDFMVHTATTGVLAVMAHLLLTGAFIPTAATPERDAGGRDTGRPSVVLYAVIVQGLALSVLWEFGEWWGHTFIDAGINVGYTDTMGDLAAGGLGALICGVVAAPRLAARGESRGSRSARAQ